MAVDDEAAAKMIGSGQKVFNMYIQAPMYNVENQTLQNVQDMVNDLEPKVKEVLYRVFAGLQVS